MTDMSMTVDEPWRYVTARGVEHLGLVTAGMPSARADVANPSVEHRDLDTR